MDENDELLVERDGGVLTLVLNRPARKNAITPEGWLALRDVLRSIDRSTDRVLVIKGAGDAFCAGADLGDIDDRRHDQENMDIVGEACLALHRLPVPTVAAVDGVAVGAGMNLALTCDFVIATDRARFSQIFVRRALSVDFGGSWILPRLVGLRIARELILLGDIIDADTALRIGLVREVVSAEALHGATQSLARRLRNGPSLAISQSKMLLNDAMEVGLGRALADEARSQTVNLASLDFQEALTAFRDKREAIFFRDVRG